MLRPGRPQLEQAQRVGILMEERSSYVLQKRQSLAELRTGLLFVDPYGFPSSPACDDSVFSYQYKSPTHVLTKDIRNQLALDSPKFIQKRETNKCQRMIDFCPSVSSTAYSSPAMMSPKTPYTPNSEQNELDFPSFRPVDDAYPPLCPCDSPIVKKRNIHSFHTSQSQSNFWWDSQSSFERQESSASLSSQASDVEGCFDFHDNARKSGLVLPTITGKKPQFNSVDCHSVASLVRGEYDHCIPSWRIVDCRYPYEYHGGHIKEAMNVTTPQELDYVFQCDGVEKDTVLVFHCEFSSERGPKMYEHLRSNDRRFHQHDYPTLEYNNMFLLEGGYQEFFRYYPELCSPGCYVQMKDDRFSSEYKLCRKEVGQSWKAMRRSRSFSVQTIRHSTIY